MLLSLFYQPQLALGPIVFLHNLLLFIVGNPAHITFQPGHAQALDSLALQGNMSTKLDTLSSQVCPVDGHPDDEASYWLDIQGESCLGYLDDIWPIS